MGFGSKARQTGSLSRDERERERETWERKKGDAVRKTRKIKGAIHCYRKRRE